MKTKISNEGYAAPKVLLDRSEVTVTSSKGKVIQCIIRDFSVNGKTGNWKFSVHRIKDDAKLFTMACKGEEKK